MKKIALISLGCAALFTACGDDDSSSNAKVSSIDTSDIIAKTFDELPDCSNDLEGTFAYVKDEKQAYTCHNKEWIPDEPSVESSSSKTEDKSSGSKVSSSSEASKTEESSSSAADKPSSSATDEPSSSETEAPSSSAESSSSAEPESPAESSSSEESSSVVSRDINVGVYQYEFSGMDFLNTSIYNNEDEAIDSLRLFLFFTATPEQVEKCATLMDSDICQIYDKDGYSSPCDNDRELRDLFRRTFPVRIDNSYDSTAGTYTYYYPVPLGSTTIAPKSRLRIDLGFSSGMSNDQYMSCETFRMPAKKKFSKESSDWSWMAHEKDVDGADFEGIPLLDRDYGDTGKAPINPYISVYRNDDLISGIIPPNMKK